MQNRRRPVVFLLGQQMRKSAFDFRVIAGLNRPKWFSSSLKSPWVLSAAVRPTPRLVSSISGLHLLHRVRRQRFLHTVQRHLLRSGCRKQFGALNRGHERG
jgi:hypothetical protein